jgi:hypothetical protein
MSQRSQYQRALSLIDYITGDPSGHPYAVTFSEDGEVKTYRFANLVAATYFIITEIFCENVEGA